jgi:hypothetical protein
VSKVVFLGTLAHYYLSGYARIERSVKYGNRNPARKD